MFWYFAIPSILLLIFIIISIVMGISMKRNYERFSPAFGMAILISIAIVCGSTALFYSVGTAGLHYKEVWGYKIISMQYWEKWSEEESYTVQVPNGTETYTDSQGKTRTRQKYRTETRYRTVYHGPYWYKIDQYGGKSLTGQDEYNSWKTKWKNETHINTNKGSVSRTSFDTPIDGKVFETTWDSTFDNMYPIAEIKTYDNIIRATTNTFSQREPTEDELALYPRPADNGDTMPIQCFGGVGCKDGDTETITKINAIIGPNKQCRLMFMLFNAEEYPRNIVDSVLASWDGVNKNELVIFAGIDKSTREVKWVSVQSWMDDTTLHSLIEGDFHGKKLEIAEKKDYWIENINKYWKRKQFTDETNGFGYIDFKMPLSIVVYNSILIFVANIILFIIVITVAKMKQKRW